MEMTMEATAYCACYKCTGKRPGDKGYGITKSGVMAGPGMVAVDENVIPMGSKLRVEGYGDALAADVGGAIKGNRIDLFMEDHNDCLEFGRKTVKVKIIN